MANSPLWYDATVIASVNSVTALLNSGFVKIYTGSQPAVDGAVTGTLLVTLGFGATAFGSATASGSGATANANSITSGTVASTGTAGYFALIKSDNSTVVATGSVGVAGTDLVLNNLVLVTGGVVSCSQFAITQVQT